MNLEVVVSSIVGTWIGFTLIAAFVRWRTPKSTAVTCAYCGEAVPMATAISGGVGAVNAAMRNHQTRCSAHPVATLLDDMERIYAECGNALRQLNLDYPLEVRRHVDKIGDIASAAMLRRI